MKLPEICIRRPVFTVAMMLVLIVIGFVAFKRLHLRELPAFDTPVVSVYTIYQGADASLMESEITTPIETALSGIPGIESITSRSRQGKSAIDVHFKLGYDINTGVSDIRDKLSQVIGSLPKDVAYPLIFKGDNEADPVLILGLMDKKRNSMELTDYAKRYLIPQLEQIEGVNNVGTWGERTYAMRVWLQSQNMAAQKIGVNDITNALRIQNVNVPGGDLRTPLRNYPLMVKTQFHTASQFRDLIVRSQDNATTRLGDISKVEVGPANIDSAFRIKGNPALALAIVPTSVSNPITVVENIQSTLKQIRAQLPSTMQVDVLYNPTQFIKASIDKVYDTWLEALFLVLIVIFLFLGNWRSTFIPIVTIPVCIVSTFALLYVFGYSINTITLLALVLAIGLVVDDAIVILENIHRYIESGLTPLQAAFKGSREISFAIIAMTLTLVAVYLPVSFAEGITGIIFRQFALTLAGAVLVSGFVALTLSPMMCAHSLRPIAREGRYTKWLEKTLAHLVDRYKKLLAMVLNYRWVVIVILILLSLWGAWIYMQSPTELAPREDRGYLMGIIHTPNNANFKYTDAYARKIEALYASIPDIQNYLMISGTWGNERRAFSIASLKPESERELSTLEIRNQLTKDIRQLPGASAHVVMPNKLAGRSSQDRGIAIQITSTVDYAQLKLISDKIIEDLKQYPGITGLDSDLWINSQQFNLKINYNLAANLQVSISDIAQALATFIGGQQVGRFSYENRDYDVLLQVPRKELMEFSVLNDLYVRSANEKMIPLSALVTVEPEVTADRLPHYNRMRVDTISAELAPGYNLGEVVSYLETYLPKILPSHAQFSFGESIQRFLQEQGYMQLIFLLALVFIYLILAAQFESFIDPFIVLLSVPLSLIGGLITLRAAGGTINIYSEIAMVTLIGLIAKHGILITEFANQKRREGMDKVQAVIVAASLRLRPILMTTGAMVLGAVPLALATGPGAINREQIGWVIVGGMAIGTFFSLFVVPVAYTFLSRAKNEIDRPN